MKSIRSYLANHIQWLCFICVVICIKGVVLYIDPLPMFFLGDSQSYIATALHGWIPPDRSFVYGYIIRLISVSTHSLTLLVIFQVVLSAFAAILATYSLERFFNVRRNVAFAIGVLCVIEPLQLLYERYVLTETLSLFVLTVYMFFIFKYLEKAKLSSLVIISIVGVMLISLRLSFLPLVMFNVFFLPLLVIPLVRRSTAASVILKNKFIKVKNSFVEKGWVGVLIFHIVISFSATFFLHAGYKDLNGTLSNSHSAYQYRSGFFLLADWAPVVTPEDFPYPNYRGVVFGDLQFDITDRDTRGQQRWVEGGLISNIKKVFPDLNEAENAAKKTAINALKRAPFDVVVLTVQSYVDYWDREKLERSMVTDRGSGWRLPELLLKPLIDEFGLDATGFHTLKTLTNSYYFAVWPWYLLLLCTPLFAVLSLIIADKQQRKYLLVIFITTSSLVIIASALVERPTIRYLHALGWLFVFIVGPMIERSLIFKAGNKSSSKSVSTASA